MYICMCVYIYIYIYTLVMQTLRLPSSNRTALLNRPPLAAETKNAKRALCWLGRRKRSGAHGVDTSVVSHQMCHFRKHATSAPAEGPAYWLDFARRCEFPLRALQAQKWHVHHGIRTFCPAKKRSLSSAKGVRLKGVTN